MWAAWAALRGPRGPLGASGLFRGAESSFRYDPARLEKALELRDLKRKAQEPLPNVPTSAVVNVLCTSSLLHLVDSYLFADPMEYGLAQLPLRVVSDVICSAVEASRRRPPKTCLLPTAVLAAKPSSGSTEEEAGGEIVMAAASVRAQPMSDGLRR